MSLNGSVLAGQVSLLLCLILGQVMEYLRSRALEVTYKGVTRGELGE